MIPDGITLAQPHLNFYDFGPTPFFALPNEQRVSYCLYVPKSFATADAEARRHWRLIVAMHGTGRTAAAYRDHFAAFADAHDCIVLAPLFPVGLIEPGEMSNYKRIKFHDMRFDRLVLDMVDLVGKRYDIDVSRVALFGFSGGGHFTHRFLYLHADRLFAVSIGAPGGVTLLDEDRDWWVGIRNLREVFGTDPDIEAMRRVAVQMVVGDADLDTWEITLKPGMPGWMPDANIAGATRVDKIRSLKASFEAKGIPVRLDLLPGVRHEGLKVVGAVQDFLAGAVAATRA